MNKLGGICTALVCDLTMCLCGSLKVLLDETTNFQFRFNVSVGSM